MIAVPDDNPPRPAPAPPVGPPHDNPAPAVVKPPGPGRFLPAFALVVAIASFAFQGGLYLQARRTPVVPRPAPSPAPSPAPAPAPYAGPLYGVLVVPDPPTADQSALRASDAVRQAAAASTVSWRTFLAGAPEVGPYAKVIADNGGPPVVLWLDDSGKLLKATRAPIEPTVIADMKGLRGK